MFGDAADVILMQFPSFTAQLSPLHFLSFLYRAQSLELDNPTLFPLQLPPGQHHHTTGFLVLKKVNWRRRGADM